MTLDATVAVPAAADADERHRKLTITCALLGQAAAELERLDQDRTLTNEQRAGVDAALELVLIAGEELGPMVV
jgi:hypothetical protein